MLRSDQISERIISVWGEGQAALACIKIITFIVDQPDQMSEMITFTDLSRISGLPTNNTTLIQAVSILSSSFEILEWMFVYFRDDKSEPHYLSLEESRHFIQRNEVFDPEAGELVDDPGSKLMPYFKANKAMLCVELL